jgi:hypothetical protein
MRRMDNKEGESRQKDARRTRIEGHIGVRMRNMN